MNLFPNPELNMFLYPFIVIGYYSNIIKKKSEGFEIGWMVVSLWLILLMFFSERDYIYTSGILLLKSEYGYLCQLKINIYRWIIGLVGSLSAVFLIKRSNLKAIKHISKVGRYSLQIYIIQCYIMRAYTIVFEKVVIHFGRNPIAENKILLDLIYSPLLSFLTVCFLIPLIRKIEKRTILAKLCFGR